MEKGKERRKEKTPTSIKLDKELKIDFDDWLRIKNKSFSTVVEDLIRDFLKKDPLTTEEKKIAKKYREV